uniref:SLC41A/MgtE integral membrane domain-containing protein n=1 Tax=Neobodo designis TaxID=312471 RepID=A0A7S1QS73_NEODS
MRRVSSRDSADGEGDGLHPRHTAVAMDSDGPHEETVARARAVGPEVGRRYLSLDANGILAVVWHRTSVLVSLLLLQSLSQFILEMYEGLIAKHVIIPLFLTMLVGAGGNAGNQATVRAITGLAGGEFAQRDYLRLLAKESVVGVINAALLAGIGFGRVYYFYGNHDMFYSTVAITLSLFLIVAISAVLGCTLPFLIGGLGFDREHAAPVIQVTMDIVGVFVTCAMCSLLIPDGESRSAPPPNVPQR